MMEEDSDSSLFLAVLKCKKCNGQFMNEKNQRRYHKMFHRNYKTSKGLHGPTNKIGNPSTNEYRQDNLSDLSQSMVFGMDHQRTSNRQKRKEEYEHLKSKQLSETEFKEISVFSTLQPESNKSKKEPQQVDNDQRMMPQLNNIKSKGGNSSNNSSISTLAEDDFCKDIDVGLAGSSGLPMNLTELTFKQRLIKCKRQKLKPPPTRRKPRCNLANALVKKSIKIMKRQSNLSTNNTTKTSVQKIPLVADWLNQWHKKHDILEGCGDGRISIRNNKRIKLVENFQLLEDNGRTFMDNTDANAEARNECETLLGLGKLPTCSKVQEEDDKDKMFSKTDTFLDDFDINLLEINQSVFDEVLLSLWPQNHGESPNKRGFGGPISDEDFQIQPAKRPMPRLPSGDSPIQFQYEVEEISEHDIFARETNGSERDGPVKARMKDIAAETVLAHHPDDETALLNVALLSDPEGIGEEEVLEEIFSIKEELSKKARYKLTEFLKEIRQKIKGDLGDQITHKKGERILESVNLVSGWMTKHRNILKNEDTYLYHMSLLKAVWEALKVKYQF